VSRRPTLSDLSANDNDFVDLDVALEFADRVRNVSVEGPIPAAFKKLRRVIRLRLDGPLPKDLKLLRHVRELTLDGDDVKKLPPGLFELPHLENIYGGDGLADQDGDFERLAAAHAKHKKRAIPKGKAALIKAIQNDEIPEGANLKGVDLSGATFEDLYVTFDLSKANLANTTWVRCDFANFAVHRMDGVDLSNAIFLECDIDAPAAAFEKVKAPGVRFERSSVDINWPGADLRNAQFLDLEPTPWIRLDKANCTGMKLDAVFHHEAETRVEAKGANLSGAHICFDVVSGRRQELAKKKNAQLKWTKDQFKGAKTNAETKIEYAELPSPSAKKATAKGSAVATDALMKGPRATHLGTIAASNAALWMLVIDAVRAAKWTGDDGGDFDRAMDIMDGPIKVDGKPAVVAEVGDCGFSHVWRTSKGAIVIVELNRSGHVDKMKEKEFLDRLAARVEQFPVRTKPKQVGKLTVDSGALALLLPYRAGDFKPSVVKKVIQSKKPWEDPEDGDRLIIPLENGDYTVDVHPFGPSRNYEDELGRYGTCIRISP
jgi:uncharacterized protein YjbI with pentapeptide repeats